MSWLTLGVILSFDPTTSEKKNPSFILAQKQMSMGKEGGVVRDRRGMESLGRRWHLTEPPGVHALHSATSAHTSQDLSSFLLCRCHLNQGPDLDLLYKIYPV